MHYISYKICEKVFINSIIHISKTTSRKVQKSKVVFIKNFKNLKQSMETDENKIKKYAYQDFLRADAPKKKEPFLMGEKIIEKKT